MALDWKALRVEDDDVLHRAFQHDGIPGQYGAVSSLKCNAVY
jgi:hypothetical protein